LGLKGFVVVVVIIKPVALELLIPITTNKKKVQLHFGTV